LDHCPRNCQITIVHSFVAKSRKLLFAMSNGGGLLVTKTRCSL